VLTRVRVLVLLGKQPADDDLCLSRFQLLALRQLASVREGMLSTRLYALLTHLILLTSKMIEPIWNTDKDYVSGRFKLSMSRDAVLERRSLVTNE
jgi:hypothetical protein